MFTRDWSRIVLSAAAVVVCVAAVAAFGEKNQLVYPDKQWQVRKPGQVGLDENELKALSEYAGGSGCVVRSGYMVYTWGNASKRRDVASAAKPVYTHFLLTAVEKKRLANIDEPVCKVESKLNSLNASLEYKDRKITWRHLCNQVSCYGVCEQPGEAYDYNDYNMALFFDCLFLKIYRSSWAKVDSDVLRPGLTDVLQCQDKPTFMAYGLKDRPGRLGISPRDFARFGLLYLGKGKWKDRQIITADRVRMAVSSPLPLSIPRSSGKPSEMISGQRSIGGGRNMADHNGSYSFAWWINGIERDGKRHWPDVPDDVYGCFGHGGMRAMVVMPSLDIIVSWNDTKIKGVKMANNALKLLVEAAEQK
jgi:hypothetical protein